MLVCCKYATKKANKDETFSSKVSNVKKRKAKYLIKFDYNLYLYILDLLKFNL